LINLFEKLPGIWKRLDISVTDVIENKGFLERYLLAPAARFNSFEDLIREYLRSQSVEQLRDVFLPLLNDITGHRWKDRKSREWNRNRIQASITRASYKGTLTCIEDLAREHGSSFCKVLDMASLVGVYDRQASMPQSSHYFDADFFHPGVFQLWISEEINLDEFLEDFQYIQHAGTRWLIRYFVADCYADIEILDYGTPISEYGATYDYTYKIFNQQFGFYDHIPQVAWEPVVYTTYWSYLHSPAPNVYGQAFYNYLPQYPVEPNVYTTIWCDINSGGYNVYGESFYSFSLQLPIQPTVSIVSDVLAVGNARIDMASLTFDWGDPEFTFEDEYVPETYNWMQPLVEPIILT
jgi:hypothetical protein